MQLSLGTCAPCPSMLYPTPISVSSISQNTHGKHRSPGTHAHTHTVTHTHTHTEWPFHTHRSQLLEGRNISLTSTSLHCDIIDALWLLWWRCESCDTPHLLRSMCMFVCVCLCVCVDPSALLSVGLRKGWRGGGCEEMMSSPNISLCCFINGRKKNQRQKLSHPLKGSKMPI